jgi:hypothetical protein
VEPPAIIQVRWDTLGDWIKPSARLDSNQEIDRAFDLLLGKKYGLMKSLFGLFSSILSRKYTILEIKVVK